MNATNRSLWALYVSQFISAFSDNAIFFVILGVLAGRGAPNPEAGMLTVQMGFLVAYVVLAPFVGAFADRNRKSTVLLAGNLLKIAGTLLLFVQAPPSLAYALVGIGAVVFSPAKYGVLVEIAGDDKKLLLKANGALESYTILAILVGTVGGGLLATYSPAAGISICVALYLISSVFTKYVRCAPGNPDVSYKTSAVAFFAEVRRLFQSPKAKFSLIGTSAFWMTSSVLRIAFLIWIAQYLGVTNKLEQSAIVGVTGVGIVIGAFLTPRLIQLNRFYRSYLYGFGMVIVIVLALVPIHLYVTAALLLLIGVMGGVFIIPMNTVLQDEGKELVGAGKTIAIQNFSENLFMIAGVGLAQLLIANQVGIVWTMGATALVLCLLVVYLKYLAGSFSAAGAGGRQP